MFGPLADGKRLSLELNEYEQGNIAIEELSRRIKPKNNQNQLSLNNDKSIECIRFKRIIRGGI